MPKPSVSLTPYWERRAEQFGIDVVNRYRVAIARGEGNFSHRAVEGNVSAQQMARKAECCFCLWLRLDPETALDWRLRPGDAGFDVTYDGLNYEVKSVPPGREYLIWPRNKNDDFHRLPFHRLVLIKMGTIRGTIWGWISKEEFWEKHEVAGPGHKLDEGTWCVHQDLVADFDPGFAKPPELFAPPPPPKQQTVPFEPRCATCGAIAHWGFGVVGRDINAGVWLCREHRIEGSRSPARHEQRVSEAGSPATQLRIGLTPMPSTPSSDQGRTGRRPEVDRQMGLALNTSGTFGTGRSA